MPSDGVKECILRNRRHKRLQIEARQTDRDLKADWLRQGYGLCLSLATLNSPIPGTDVHKQYSQSLSTLQILLYKCTTCRNNELKPRWKHYSCEVVDAFCQHEPRLRQKAQQKDKAALVFTALHGMETRSSDENTVCLSVRPLDTWIVTKHKKYMFRFLYHTKDHLV